MSGAAGRACRPSRNGVEPSAGAPLRAGRRSDQEAMSRVARLDQPSRSQRLARILERDGPTCVWCGRAFAGLVRPTTEHLVPRLKGGPSWLENEVAACRRCNGQRGHVSLGEWADECERRGWPVDRARLVRTLDALALAIAERGGQRRARPWLAAQRRRLG